MVKFNAYRFHSEIASRNYSNNKKKKDKWNTMTLGEWFEPILETRTHEIENKKAGISAIKTPWIL